MLTVHTVEALRAQLARWREAGETLALVPTMGNLHEGHLSLVRRARSEAQRVVVSIFVNPLQFGPSEDFDRYPRTLDEDQQRLRGVGCDLVFAPTVSEMYPGGRSGITRVSVPGLGEQLEGEFRPGFFDGVATVVNILFNCVQPQLAVFGEKDYQQLLVIRRMVAELQLPIRVIGEPTAREPDGLALSSRNQYLSAEERRLAPTLHRALQAVAERLRSGARDYAGLQQEAQRYLEAQGFKPQYVAIREPQRLEPPSPTARDWVILVAAHLGRTRLIDNLVLSL
ncbi:MAG TPA: pantoate--beta-alanine ligase [Nevskiaceae bacterium]|nr:pantoate--beta-alanine ligase [Nevskiaceae bacterium]